MNITLNGENGMRLVVSTLGATVRELWVAAQTGELIDVALGYDTDKEYIENDGYLGATIGRNANRLKNSQITVNKKVYQLTVNEHTNQLHGGKTGFSHREFSILEQCENKAALRLISPDGDEGYPGELELVVTYELEGESVKVSYDAVCSADTTVNLTNHTYFNLNGHASGSALNHVLMIPAKGYTPCDDENIPLGTIAGVDGTALDFTSFHIVGSRMGDAGLKRFNGYDNNYVLRARGEAAVLMGDKTKLFMAVDSNRPGMQLYTANYLSKRRGKGGASYEPYCAVCLEPQFFPNSANEPAFKRMGDPTLKKAERYHQQITYAFTR